MTQKLSGCHVSLSLGLTCIPDTIVTTFVPNILKVFAINRIDQKTYPEKFDKSLNLSVNDILYELHHTYRCYNDITEEPPFDIGKSVNLSGFVEMLAATAESANLVPVVEDKSNPASWIMRPSTAFAGSVLIVKSNVTSTIVKLSAAGVEPTILGYMEYPYPYVMRTKPVLNCITEPDPIVPTVTVNLETLEIAWQPNETYTVEVEDGFVNHEYGMKYSNPAFSEPFTTNQPPYLVSWEPENAPETGHIQSARLKYVRRIKHGDQAIKLYKSPSTLVKTYLPTDPEVQIVNGVINGYEGAIIVSIDVRDYLESNQEYYIHVEQGALYDYDFFANSAISDNSTITFTASMPNYIDWFPGPVTETRNNQTVKVVYPYTALPNSSATGTIRFYDGDDNLLRTFHPTDATVTYQATTPSLAEYPYSTTITFDVLGLLREDSTYYLVIDEGVFQDVDEFNSVSVLDINELRYSTDNIIFPGLRSNPIAISALNAINVRPRTFLINSQANASVYTNAMMVRLGTGHLYSEATVSTTARYLATFFNVTNRLYVANQYNYIFTGSTINDHDSGSSYKVTFSSPAGKFGTMLGGITNYEITGTLAEIKSKFESTAFWPTKNYSSLSSYTVTLYRNNELMQTLTKTLTNSGIYLGDTYTFNESGSWTPNLLELYYGFQMDYIVVGGGGSGFWAYPNTELNVVGAPGGGGEVVEITNIAISNTTYDVIVGIGGEKPTIVNTSHNGTSSSFNAHTANGGYGGTSTAGGMSGSGNAGGLNVTSTSVSNPNLSIKSAGGGGGATSIGQDGGVYMESTYSHIKAYGGNGGSGYWSPVFNDTTYGRGGFGGTGTKDIDPYITWGGDDSRHPSQGTTGVISEPGRGGLGWRGNWTTTGLLPWAGNNGVVKIKTKP